MSEDGDNEQKDVNNKIDILNDENKNSDPEYEAINQEINELKDSIGEYYIGINKTLFNIQKMLDKCTIVKSTIKSIKSMPPLDDSLSGRSSRTSSSRSGYRDEQILQKHQLKLDGKLKEIHRLQDELGENQVTYNNLVEKLRMLLNDECEIQIQITSAESEVREYNVNKEINKRRIEFLNDQIKERKKELHQLRVLKGDAERALNMLKEREEKYAFVEEQNSVGKTIASRQNELVRLETEIQSVRRRMYEFKENTTIQSLQYQSSIQDHEASANWEEEKITLNQTLNDLRQKVKILKQHQVYYVSEAPKQTETFKTGSLSAEDRNTYGMLMRKWARDPGDEPYQGKISTAWRQIQEPRIILAQLMDENVKKSKQLNRLKETLQLTVDKFRKREQEIIFDSQRKTQEFEEQEREMIVKIRKLKIKLAQIRLDKEKR